MVKRRDRALAVAGLPAPPDVPDVDPDACTGAPNCACPLCAALTLLRARGVIGSEVSNAPMQSGTPWVASGEMLAPPLGQMTAPGYMFTPDASGMTAPAGHFVGPATVLFAAATGVTGRGETFAAGVSAENTVTGLEAVATGAFPNARPAHRKSCRCGICQVRRNVRALQRRMGIPVSD